MDGIHKWRKIFGRRAVDGLLQWLVGVDGRRAVGRQFGILFGRSNSRAEILVATGRTDECLLGFLLLVIKFSLYNTF